MVARPAPFSNAAPTDEAIDFNRRIAARLMQQGTSTEPVGHWTAALARALQGASGSMWNDQARQGEQDAEASVQAALSGKMDPKTLMANPRTRGIGLQVWQSQQAEARAARERAAAQNDPMRQLQLRQAELGVREKELGIERLRQQQEFDREMLGTAPQQGAPQPAPQQQPMPPTSPAMGARAAASDEGPSRVGGFAAPLTEQQAPTPSAPAAPSTAAQIREAVAKLPPERQAAFRALVMQGDRKGALALLTKSPDDKPLTEQQTKDASFAERLMRAEKNLTSVAPIDADGKFTKYDPTTWRQRFGPNTDASFTNLWLSNFVNSKEWQQWDRAARETLAVILRKDTGAAVTNEEFALYGPMYIPMPGDNPEVVKQKAEARRAIADGLKGASGRAWDRMYPGLGGGSSNRKTLDLGDGFTAEID